MTKKEIRNELNQDLVKFLKQNKCLTKYVNNCFLKSDRDLKIDIQTIFYAFTWRNTPEGFHFWYDIDNSYDIYIINIQDK